MHNDSGILLMCLAFLIIFVVFSAAARHEHSRSFIEIVTRMDVRSIPFRCLEIWQLGDCISRIASLTVVVISNKTSLMLDLIKTSLC